MNGKFDNKNPKFTNIPVITKNSTKNKSLKGLISARGVKFLPCSEIKTPAKKAAIEAGKPTAVRRKIESASVKIVAKIDSSWEGYLKTTFKNLGRKNLLAAKIRQNNITGCASEIKKLKIDTGTILSFEKRIGSRNITGIINKSWISR